MRGIAAFLIIAVLALPAQATGTRLSAADASCPDKVDASSKPAVRARATAPVRDAGRAKSSVHGDVGDSTRPQSPRWHSFLPGMIR